MSVARRGALWTDERRLTDPAQVPAHDERRLTDPAQVPAHDERRLTDPAQVPAHEERSDEGRGRARAPRGATRETQ
jgi:hypothetical protein